MLDAAHAATFQRPDPEAFRKGIFALRTRRFGTVAELLIQRLLGASRGRIQFHDLWDDSQERRIEVKFSTVNSKAEAPISFENLLEAVAEAGQERAVPFSTWREHAFDCAIQQVKPAEFDLLYFGLFFTDEIVIFRATREDILGDSAIRYSDRQHKGNQAQ
ncbi:hypothetical protein ACEUZ9_000319 [Paracoccus litorisediminis]|uniref:hypothetical protein n=1 Tax=Paracoccus litorisediminis TaxID=2006130 RepID=UPI00372FD4FA